MSLNYYVIDTETTGLTSGHHEVTQISIIRCSDRNQLTRKIRAEFPERAQPQALQITNRTFEDLLEGDSKEKVVDECNEFFAQDSLTIEHRCLIAHNSNFDCRFCHALWANCKKEFPAIYWMDTIKFAKDWSKQTGIAPENFKLASVLKFANITPMQGQHEAGADARNTYLLWKRGTELGIDHLNAIKRCPHSLNIG
jgi:DNA polymerase III epsilon subunit-like protein